MSDIRELVRAVRVACETAKDILKKQKTESPFKESLKHIADALGSIWNIVGQALMTRLWPQRSVLTPTPITAQPAVFDPDYHSYRMGKVRDLVKDAYFQTQDLAKHLSESRSLLPGNGQDKFYNDLVEAMDD